MRFFCIDDAQNLSVDLRALLKCIYNKQISVLTTLNNRTNFIGTILKLGSAREKTAY